MMLPLGERPILLPKEMASYFRPPVTNLSAFVPHAQTVYAHSLFYTR
jgi:hypothetical protein